MVDLYGRQASAGCQAIERAFEPHDEGVLRMAEALGRLSDRVEHGLNVRRRTADDIEDIARRRLILKQLRELVGPRLHFLKKPCVCDRDHCLVGEGFNEVDLLVRKRFDHCAQQTEHSDGHAVAYQRDSEHRSEPANLLMVPVSELGVIETIGQVDGAALQRSSADSEPRPSGIGRPEAYFTRAASGLLAATKWYMSSWRL